MARGYMGKILFVNLSTGELKDEVLEEKLCRDFIGGYGIGARIIYGRQKPGVDPLGPENILGFMTCPVTGTPVVASSRYAAIGKSPLTGGWGDANSGGDFGPFLKFAGYDGMFINAGFRTTVINSGSWPYADSEYHLPGDVPERVNIENVVRSTQLLLAAILDIDARDTSILSRM